MLEFSYDFNLAVAQKGLNYYLMGWNYLISSTPLRGPQNPKGTQQIRSADFHWKL